MVCDIRTQSPFCILPLKLSPSCFINAATSCTVLNAQTISLTSDLQHGSVACPNSVLVFTCVTQGSLAIAWQGDYVGDQIGFLAVRHQVGDTSNSSSNPNTVATLTRNYIDNGVQVLETKLRIFVSLSSANPSVKCVHEDSGNTSSFPFQVLGKYVIICTFVNVSCYCRNCCQSSIKCQTYDS